MSLASWFAKRWPDHWHHISTKGAYDHEAQRAAFADMVKATPAAEFTPAVSTAVPQVQPPDVPAKAEENTVSFFSKLVSSIESMWKKAPSAAVAAASAINYVVPFVESIDVIVTPELAPVLNPILDKIKVGLTALKVTVQNAGTSPNLASIVTSINTNLDALIAAAQIKDAAVAEKIKAVAVLITGELAAITA